MEEDAPQEEVPDWVVEDGGSEEPSSTTILEGSAISTPVQKEQVFVQAGQHGTEGIPTTNAAVALALGIVGLFLMFFTWIFGICSSIPGVILAQGAINAIAQHPGHPDQGIAKAALVINWIVIGLTLISIVGVGILVAIIGWELSTWA
ncbi:MAG: DUF4190 domain-containing protein [Candidatus Thermoplasmatota archaeon]|jgi:hypothetical protein|nr:DUF4190 domain-containing protein [Candidatus Thermoplasmatota archaeon]